jgi:hypothetical protein
MSLTQSGHFELLRSEGVFQPKRRSSSHVWGSVSGYARRRNAYATIGSTRSLPCPTVGVTRLCRARSNDPVEGGGSEQGIRMCRWKLISTCNAQKE